MKSIAEILKSKGITEATRYHNYEYLHKAMVESCDEYGRQFHKPDVSGNEALRVSVAFAELKKWLEQERDKYDTPTHDNQVEDANSWGYFKAYENTLFKIEELSAKATDR